MELLILFCRVFFLVIVAFWLPALFVNHTILLKCRDAVDADDGAEENDKKFVAKDFLWFLRIWKFYGYCWAEFASIAASALHRFFIIQSVTTGKTVCTVWLFIFRLSAALERKFMQEILLRIIKWKHSISFGIFISDMCCKIFIFFAFFLQKFPPELKLCH